MRILMVSDFYPPIIGGLERHVQTLSRGLVARGHQVSVATLWREGSPSFEIDNGVRVHRLKGWSQVLRPLYEDAERRYHPTLPDPGVMAGLRRILQREKPDIVHARGWMLYSLLPLPAAIRGKTIVTLHDYSLVCPKKNFLYHDRACLGPAYAKCIRCATDQFGYVKSAVITSGLSVSSHMHGRVDKYLAVSESVRAASASSLGHPPRPIEVVPTFIPDTVLEEAAEAGRPEFLPAEDNYILFVGALGAHKGLHVLLKAYEEQLSCIAPLVVIGIDRSDAPKRFPAGVTVVRNVPHPQVMAAWIHCSIGVVPSIWPEPFGQVAIEAMACGRPVVASAIGGLQDSVVHGETGLLVPPGDDKALAEAIRSLLNDPARRAAMGEAGRKRARLFMASTVISRIEQVYREVLENV